jgi:hypothetical protein
MLRRLWLSPETCNSSVKEIQAVYETKAQEARQTGYLQ